MKIGLVIGAVLLAAGGLYYAVFGAFYQGTYVAGTEGACGPGCSYSNSEETTVTFTDYPIWSSPSFTGVDYSMTTTCVTTSATYTPRSPPPSCLFPPANMSTDYTKNYGGVFLVVAGVLAVMAVIMNREPRLESGPSTTPQEQIASATKSPGPLPRAAAR